MPQEEKTMLIEIRRNEEETVTKEGTEKKKTVSLFIPEWIFYILAFFITLGTVKLLAFIFF